MQLADLSRGNNITVPTLPQFVPSSSALACNIFWFTSLGLSLSCALVATLLGQWAQHFLHRAEMRSATPVVAARIMSYLYYGIRRFDMHTVVAVIPLLLHASLFFFFAGLIAFLIPVNLAVTVVCAAIMFFFTVIYVAFTVFPLFYLDCPYRTPLSDSLWWITGWFRRIFSSHSNKPNKPHSAGMVQAMTHRATADSDERTDRDCRALSWTVRCLVDDKQLETFVRCIPGLLQHDLQYQEHIKALINNQDIQLYIRIQGMVLRASGGFTDADYSVGVQALWAIVKIQPALAAALNPQLIEAAYEPPANGYRDTSLHLLPLATFARNRTFSALDVEMAEVVRYLEICQVLVARGRAVDVNRVIDCIEKMNSGDFDQPESKAFDELLGKQQVGSPAWIQQAIACIQSFRSDIPYFMLFRYFTYAAPLGSEPYDHEYTCNSFQLSPGPLSSAVVVQLEATFNAIATPPLYYSLASVTAEGMLRHLVRLWRVLGDTNRIPQFILQYLHDLNNDSSFRMMLPEIDCVSLWSTILFHSTRFELGTGSTELADLTPDLFEPALSLLESLAPSARTTNLIALLKIAILASFSQVIPWDKSSYLAALENPHLPSGILPADTATTIPEDVRREPLDNEMMQEQLARLWGAVRARCEEGLVLVLADFLDACADDPSESAEKTLAVFPKIIPSVGAVHASHQRRLADSVHRLFPLDRPGKAVRQIQGAVLDLHLFQVGSLSWLDEPEAAKMVAEAFGQRKIREDSRVPRPRMIMVPSDTESSSRSTDDSR
ncbi:hypothetical protein B0H17DRAFT_1196241 [Mycena rosella]|uniref:DUF6535 domain-containing protein n=1 Tax=Mycena rosella TaxID=1033263 RepID=A0AAD7GQB9_MYCRO|nr:hypothetical protein B0H17DRAFT_1196241 [Mycena rosella]